MCFGISQLQMAGRGVCHVSRHALIVSSLSLKQHTPPCSATTGSHTKTRGRPAQKPARPSPAQHAQRGRQVAAGTAQQRTLTVLSSEAVAYLRSVGEKLTWRTASRWACKSGGRGGGEAFQMK